MARYLVVDSNNVIINAIEWDGRAPWAPPKNCRVMQSDQGEIGELASASKSLSERFKTFWRVLRG